MNYNIPLMSDNITREDVNELVNFLQQDPIPRLTNGPKVEEFEAKWSEWLGVKHSVFVNSGSSANYMTMQLLQYKYGPCEVIVPPLTWVSDVASVLNTGHNPVFVDINLSNLSFNIQKLKQAITTRTKAIFLTHVLGLNGLTDELIQLCKEHDLLLIEDVCESHGATFKNKKAGSIGDVSNFSFYFAHHLSTIEGGMVCTDNDEFYDILRFSRSHGMVRECKSEDFKQQVKLDHPDLNPDFIFLSPAYNFRSTELNAVLGLSQIKSLDSNNDIRRDNFEYFLSKLDSTKYVTTLDTKGQSNYAFIVIMKEADITQRNKVESMLKSNNIEFRRGLSGGGNQLRQPYISRHAEKIGRSWQVGMTDQALQQSFANIEHVHNYSWYIGNYPSLEREKITNLITLLNNV
tara:strand:- start:18536 stop:19747 length:1212 start_codon:yes stop_codon:yes gene_type:complete